MKHSALTGSKAELMDILQQENEEAVLFSINNPYIIPADLVCKQNFSMINLHHALLPAHPGRNAEAWTIFDGDRSAGITWHRIDSGTDSGNILIQKSVSVTDRTTSISLLKELNKLAVEALAELMPLDVLIENPGIKQSISAKRTVRLAKEIPAGGVLDPEWDEKKVSRFLRAMDYSLLNVLGKPSIVIQNTSHQILFYKIISKSEKTTVNSDQMLISKDNLQFLLTLS